jgi:hypothetical protein
MQRLVMTLTFVAGAALLALAAWTRPLTDADAARRAGRAELALERYGQAEARFDRLPASKRLLPAARAASESNQLRLMYSLQQYDALNEKANAADAGPAAHFWAGCALFTKARAEEESEARLGWVSRAEEEFRRALEANPDDWDTKYNYELTKRLLVGLRKQPQMPSRQLLQLLRPQPKTARPVRRTG